MIGYKEVILLSFFITFFINRKYFFFRLVFRKKLDKYIGIIGIVRVSIFKNEFF